MFCNRTNAPGTTLDLVTNRILLPTELVTGCCVQILNLAILRQKQLKRLRYVSYLKIQSIIYLVNCAVLIPALLRKNHLSSSAIYGVVFYHAHFEKSSINFFIFLGNLVTVALGLEPLLALLFPFRQIKQPGGGGLDRRERRKWAAVGAGVCCMVLIVVLPVGFMKVVIPQEKTQNGTASYCIQPVSKPWVQHVRYLEAVIFELFAIAIILVTYSWLFVKYLQIQRSHSKTISNFASGRRAEHHTPKQYSIFRRLRSFKFSNSTSKSSSETTDTKYTQQRSSTRLTSCGNKHSIAISGQPTNASIFNSNNEEAKIPLGDRTALSQQCCSVKSQTETTGDDLECRCPVTITVDASGIDSSEKLDTNDVKRIPIACPESLDTTSEDSLSEVQSSVQRASCQFSAQPNGNSPKSSTCHSSLSSGLRHSKSVTFSSHNRQANNSLSVSDNPCTDLSANSRHCGGSQQTLLLKVSDSQRRRASASATASMMCQTAASSTAAHSRRHQKATALCLGSMTAFLVCNLPSALLELAYLSCSLSGRLQAFFAMPGSNVWRNVANVMLIFNFTLTFATQCFACAAYRSGLRAIFCSKYRDAHAVPYQTGNSSVYTMSNRQADKQATKQNVT